MHYLLSLILYFHKLQVNISIPYSQVSSAVKGYQWFPDKAGGGGYMREWVNNVKNLFQKKNQIDPVLQYFKQEEIKDSPNFGLHI